MPYALSLIAALGLLQITNTYCRQRLDEGVRLMQLGRMQEAAIQSQPALAVDSNNVDALIERGVNLWKAGKFADALPYFERARDLRPNRAKVHQDLAEDLIRLGREHEAVAEIAIACKL